METFVLELEPETLRRIEEAAQRAGRRPQDLVRETVEAAFAPPDPNDSIEDIGAYLTAKNAELYRRLS